MKEMRERGDGQSNLLKEVGFKNSYEIGKQTCRGYDLLEFIFWNYLISIYDIILIGIF